MIEHLLIIVFIVSMAVCFGWFMDIAILKSAGSDYVTMKFTTALSFVLSSVMLYLLRKKADLFAVCIGLSIIMFNVWAAFFSAELLFPYYENDSSNYTVRLGFASLGTFISFLLIGLYSLAYLERGKIARFFEVATGGLVYLTGLVALIGYTINTPLLYYYYEDISTGMAIHTAVLFILVSLAMVKLANEP